MTGFGEGAEAVASCADMGKPCVAGDHIGRVSPGCPGPFYPRPLRHELEFLQQMEDVMNQIDISFLGIQLKARGIAGIVGAVVVLAILLAYSIVSQ